MDLGKLQTLQTERTCQECGQRFKNRTEETAMQQHVDHMALHQPNSGQWTEAYNKIMAGKAR